MSRRDSNSKSQPADIYVGLLFVSVGALAAGIGFLCWELTNYGWQVAP